mgnify:CR=1 FL=1
MSILILNRSPHSLCPYEKFLKPLNEKLILLTANKVAPQFQNLGYDHIESFENYETNGLVELRAIELFEQYRFHTIIAIAEVDLIRAARLRERFHLKGQHISSAIDFRDKVRMKKLAQQADIPTPPITRIEQPIDIIQFTKVHGYPIIIKPVDGVGSKDTYILHNHQDLARFLQQGIPSSYVAESFIKGEICHVDGMIIDHQIQFICASKYINNPLCYNEKGYLGSYILHPQNPLSQRLLRETEKVLQHFQLPPTTTFHAEWFHTPSDQLVFCEIASRTGGGKIIQTVSHAFGVDLFQAFVEPQCNIPYLSTINREIQGPKQMTGWIKIPPKQGIFQWKAQEDLPEWVIEFELLGKIGKSYDSPNGIGPYIAAFVVKGDSENDVTQKLINIAEWFHQSTKWVSF